MILDDRQSPMDEAENLFAPDNEEEQNGQHNETKNGEYKVINLTHFSSWFSKRITAKKIPFRILVSWNVNSATEYNVP